MTELRLHFEPGEFERLFGKRCPGRCNREWSPECEFCDNGTVTITIENPLAPDYAMDCDDQPCGICNGTCFEGDLLPAAVNQPELYGDPLGDVCADCAEAIEAEQARLAIKHVREIRPGIDWRGLAEWLEPRV